MLIEVTHIFLVQNLGGIFMCISWPLLDRPKTQEIQGRVCSSTLVWFGSPFSQNRRSTTFPPHNDSPPPTLSHLFLISY